ncbi:MAG TPA: hypothetical protein VE396_06550 [Xanthobacteraceae bacterium]|nr:hypothetical protein [Xanthobacteraceae bacterium]
MSTANSAKSKAQAKASPPAGAEGYKGHKPGSRKETIHQLYDREGADTAWTRGRKMKLAEGTLRSWFGQWQRGASKSKPVPKTLPKGKSDKTPETLAKPVEIPEAIIGVPEPAVITA